MRTIITATALAAIVFLTTGCAFYGAPVVPGIGAIYTETAAPLDHDVTDTKLGSKTGKASVTTILGLVSTGDASTTAAARNGGITTIRHLDYEYKSILGIISTFTTVAKGD